MTKWDSLGGDGVNGEDINRRTGGQEETNFFKPNSILKKN
jgi:hypothetical protein